MLPIRLKFIGLHSYKTEADIDFNALVEAQLFGIFGATGSGKSTILEAITLALFGESERLGNSYAAVVNLSSPEMKIEFEFSQKNELYLFELKYTRAKGSLEIPAKLLYHRASKKVGDNWLPLSDKGREVKSLAVEILGITADNFRRTTIIPQGKFQGFLTLKGADRGEMMESLFKLEQFNLSDKVKAMATTTNADLQFGMGELASIGQAEASAIAALKLELQALKERLKTKQVNFKQQTDLLTQQDNLAKLNQQYQASNAEFAKLSAEQTERQVAYDKAKLFERTSQLVGPLLEGIQRTTQQQTRELQSRANFESELNRLVADIQTNVEKLTALQPRYDDREHLTKQAEAARQAVNWHTVSMQAQQTTAEIGRYEVGLDDVMQQKQMQEKGLVAQQLALTRLQASVDEAAELAQLASWYQREDDLNRQMAVLQQDWNNIDQEVQAINKGIKTLKAGVPFRTAGLDAAVPDWNLVHHQLTDQVEVQEVLVRHLAVQQKLAGMAHTLVDGEPCPLCGSAEHPAPLAEGNLANEHDTAKVKLDELKLSLKTFSNLQTEWEKRQHTLATAVAKYTPVKQKLEGLQGERNTHLLAFVWQGYRVDNRSAFGIAQHQLGIDRVALKQQQIDIKSTEANIVQLQGRLDNGNAMLVSKKQHLASQQGQLAQLAKLVDGSLLPDWQAYKVPLLEQSIQNYTNRRLTLENDFNKLNDQAQKMALRQKATETSLQANAKQLADIGNELTRLQQSLTKSLTILGFSSQGEAEVLLRKYINFEHVAADYDAYKSRLAAVQGQLLMLEGQLNNQPYDQGQHIALRQQVDELKAETDQLNQQLATVTERLTTAQSVLKRRAELEAKIQKLSFRQAGIKQLEVLFRGRGFVNFISGIYLRGVIDAANIRFKALTRNQLSLEIDDKTEFFVRDYLNDGKQRPIKTLSGGQTFQAALCLALALSELIAHGENQFFFLDEGFGTQDRDALNDVISALQDLRNEGRVVGIISHVEELKQLLDVSLIVTNDAVGGSKVRVV